MKHKKTTIAIISVIALALVIIGVTYAYWVVTRTQEKQNTISTGCLDIDLTNEKNDITLEEAFPTSDEDGMKLTPYEFTITNKCDSAVDYQVALETIGDESKTVIASAIKVALDDSISLLSDKPNMEPTYTDAFAAKKLTMGTLAAYSETSTDDSVTYNLRLWIDADAPISEMNKTFESKITVSVGQGIFNPYKEGTLAYDIISNYDGEAAIIEVEDFSVVTTGLYKAVDDLGDSYYFRGDVSNNYVKFGKWDSEQKSILGYISTDNWYTYLYNSTEKCVSEGNDVCIDVTGKNMYWRIMRINGNGTIRLIYDGTEKGINKSEYIDYIGSSSYSSSIIDTGYTYDNNGVETSSDIKTFVDNWYETNLKTNYEKYISDEIFCNDRQNSLNESYGDYYDAYYRIDNYSPTLKCPKHEDRYTINKKIGNGLLTNPVGLITADEVMMTRIGGSNISSWTYYRTMTPYYKGYINEDGYDTDSAVFVFGHGEIQYGPMETMQHDSLVRPVINLKADVLFTGDGSFETPYEIVMN